LENPVLPENQVDIWRIDLVRQPDEIQHYRRVLSHDEIERADRFYFEKHRRRFIVARAAMRQVLGRYASIAPGKLAFSYGARGKPELAGGPLAGGPKERLIQFNLSHSEDLALLAVAQGLVLGVDVELVNPEFSTDEIAERFFSPGEVRCLQALPAGARAEAFFSCWTRKEAYIKALGEGLHVPLDSFEVAFAPGIPAALLQVKVDPREVERWRMYDIEVPAGFKAALVVEGRGHRVRHFLWHSEP
jgi:4'-phosphopantetheinyl transferase